MNDDDEMLVMHDRCADCAFRAGTTPQNTPLQPEKARLCVEASVAFYCHEHPETPGSSAVLCKGFVDAFTAKMNAGYYKGLPEWKRNVLIAALDAIEMCEDGKEVDLIQMVRDLPVPVNGP